MLTIEASQATPITTTTDGARAIVRGAIEAFSWGHNPTMTEAFSEGVRAARLPDALTPDQTREATHLASLVIVDTGGYDVSAFTSAETRIATLYRALAVLGGAS